MAGPDPEPAAPLDMAILHEVESGAAKTTVRAPGARISRGRLYQILDKHRTGKGST